MNTELLHAYSRLNPTVHIHAWISNYIHYKVWDAIKYLFPKFNGCTFAVILSHTLLEMCLLIHTGIKDNPC